MQGVARGPPPQASRRFLLKPPVDAFWNHPGGDQVEPPFGSIELTWPGRANRSTRSFGGRRYRRALEVWLCRCGSYASRVGNRMQNRCSASRAGAPKRCSSDPAMDRCNHDGSSAIPRCSTRRCRSQAAQLPCALPAGRLSAMILRRPAV